MPIWLQANQRCTFRWWVSNPPSWVFAGFSLVTSLAIFNQTSIKASTAVILHLWLGTMCASWNMHVWPFSACKEWALKNAVVENSRLHNHGPTYLRHLETLQREGVYDSKEIKSLWPRNIYQTREKKFREASLTWGRSTIQKCKILIQSYFMSLNVYSF